MKLGGILGGSWEGYWEEAGRDTGRKLGGYWEDKGRNLLYGGEEGGNREERGEVSRRKGGNG